MIGLCNHQITATMVVLDRRRLLPFVLWRDSIPLLPEAINYAREKAEGRKFAVLVSNVGMLAELVPHAQTLKELDARVAVFDSFHALKSVKVPVVDAKERPDGTWEAVELTPAEINNLLLSDEARIDDEPLRLITVAPSDVLSPEDVAAMTRADDASDLPNGPLARTVAEITSDEHLRKLIAQYVLGKISEKRLRAELGSANVRQIKRAIKRTRGPLVRAYHFLSRVKENPRWVCKKWNIAPDDLHFLFIYA